MLRALVNLNLSVISLWLLQGQIHPPTLQCLDCSISGPTTRGSPRQGCWFRCPASSCRCWPPSPGLWQPEGQKKLMMLNRWAIYLFIFLSIYFYPSIYLSIYLSICLFVCLSVCLSINLSIDWSAAPDCYRRPWGRAPSARPPSCPWSARTSRWYTSVDMQG